MKVKKTLEKVGSALYWIAVGYLTVRLLLGKANVLTEIVLVIAYFNLLLKGMDGILCLILKIQDYKLHKTYKKGFLYFKTMHKIRYKLYFSGDSDEIATYSKEIESMGKLLVSVGEERINDKKISKKIRKELIEMVDTTKKLMATIQSC